MSGVGEITDVERALQELWENHTIQPRWAAIGVEGRDRLIAEHGFKPEDFQRFGNLYFIGNPDANAIMDAENAAMFPAGFWRRAIAKTAFHAGAAWAWLSDLFGTARL